MGVYLLASIALASTVAAQQPAWAQCGGESYTGDTTCVSGYSCVSVNEYYSQCQVASATTTTLVTVTTTSAASATTTTAAATGAAGFQFLGRVNPATRELSWPGSGLGFTFEGTSASIALTSVTGTNSVDVFIDGGDPIVISNVEGTSISTPSGLSSGSHTVELRKRSEALYGSIFIGDVTTDGTLGTYDVPDRRIEIIGDSISVGYGLDGVNPCTNNASVEDNPLTYGAVAATALGAEYSVVAWSGKGIIRNYVGDETELMPELYTRYGALDADNSYTFPTATAPAAVVINLGTNDFGYLGYDASGNSYAARDPIDAAAYTAAMVDFVQSIQAHYPDAHFFLLSSPMLSDTFPTAADAQKTTQTNALQDAVAQLGNSTASFVDWPTQGSDVGCDYHPNAATHAAEGAVLASAISTALGW